VSRPELQPNLGVAPRLAKLTGVAVLLIPFVSARLREWAYAGNLVSAIVTHVSIRDIPLAFAPSTITTALWRSRITSGFA